VLQILRYKQEGRNPCRRIAALCSIQ
jgi:hypothetical protein